MMATRAMPVSWHIDRGLVRIESSEPSAFGEWRRAVEGFLAHPLYRRGMGAVHDWRSHKNGLPTAEIQARSHYLVQNAANFGRMRWALVAPADVAYGMGRMAETLTSAPNLELRVFRDMEEAEAWVRALPPLPEGA
jgi:hypothetical protein